jgi:hypothetical protein
MLTDFECDYERQQDYINKIAKKTERCSNEYTAWRALMPILSYLKVYDRTLYEKCMTYSEEWVKDVIL